MNMKRLGIMAALPQELGDLIAQMQAAGEVRTRHARAARILRRRRARRAVVVTLARIGKVAAAATASALIHVFDVDAHRVHRRRGRRARGRAGRAMSSSRDALLQHDLDASPLFPRYEVPLLRHARVSTPIARLPMRSPQPPRRSSQQGGALAERFAVAAPRVHRGLVVSGDRFIASHEALFALRDALPDALAVEMEGAAIAQVCYEHDVPCAVVRTISDTADAAAPASFAEFLSDDRGDLLVGHPVAVPVRGAA